MGKISNPKTMNVTEQMSTEDKFIIQEVLEKNLNYATTKNIDGYLSTISQKGHEATREAMLNFFKDYEVSHTLLHFEVVQEESDEVVVKTRQKSEGTSQLKDVEYKNHVAEVLHVFIKEEDSWKIEESSITNITFTE